MAGKSTLFHLGEFRYNESHPDAPRANLALALNGRHRWHDAKFNVSIQRTGARLRLLRAEFGFNLRGARVRECARARRTRYSRTLARAPSSALQFVGPAAPARNCTALGRAACVKSARRARGAARRAPRALARKPQRPAVTARRPREYAAPTGPAQQATRETPPIAYETLVQCQCEITRQFPAQRPPRLFGSFANFFLKKRRDGDEAVFIGPPCSIYLPNKR
ncbi:unnamed protein product, partial [Iphiclides podalirius]